MEIDAIHRIHGEPQASAAVPESGMADLIKTLGIETLTRQLKGVQSELTKVKAMLADTKDPSTKPSPPKRSGKKETRKCYFCDKVGHVVKDCRKRQEQANPGNQ